jgi:hypothetical protein
MQAKRRRAGGVSERGGFGRSRTRCAGRRVGPVNSNAQLVHELDSIPLIAAATERPDLGFDTD